MCHELEEHNKIGFYTATILNWKKLLKPDKYKEIVLGSLRFLVQEGRANVYGFVLMPNHIHLLWKIEKQLHNNPVQGKWMLSADPLDYKYSSIRFYENKENRFDFLTHYREFFE